MTSSLPLSPSECSPLLPPPCGDVLCLLFQLRPPLLWLQDARGTKSGGRGGVCAAAGCPGHVRGLAGLGQLPALPVASRGGLCVPVSGHGG